MNLIEVIITLLIVSIILIIVHSSQILLNHYKLLSLIVELKDYKEKNLSFHTQYKWLAGDFPFANKMWPTECSQIKFCNGNGDNSIKDIPEGINAWNHLLYSKHNKFIPYNNKYHKIEVDINTPQSKLFKGGFQLLADTKMNYSKLDLRNIGRNFLRFAAQRKKGNLMAPILTAKQANYIDIKIDDAAPLSGILLAGINNIHDTNKCFITTKNIYSSNDNDISCYIQFLIL